MEEQRFTVKFKSIVIRWFFQVFLIVAAVIVVAAIALSAFFITFHLSRVRDLAIDYSYEFSNLSAADLSTFEDAAVSLSDAFAHKNKIEVQVIDKEGNVVVSTTGFQTSRDVMTDYESAISSDSGSAVWRGENSGGEKIMAGTTLVHNAEGEHIGAYRWITSLESTWNRIYMLIGVIFATAIAAIGICSLSGIFFIKSIVRPIRDVSNTARRIALGDFKSKIKITRNDEIGELCDTINYMATELSHAETLKNDFISSVSHELRTPLTAIRGWGETVKMSIGTDDELVARGMEVVLSEADRLSSLVEELLDFSRMQSGRLTVNTMPIDVSELLRTVADMYTELARQQGIELSFTPPAENSIVLGDPDRLKQVFINIIDNAVKYTEKGGLVLVQQLREEGCVQIIVKDTGVGIPAADLDHVKEKFFKSNKTVRGSGIGLAVADEIIKQHQGLLFLESTEGVGTTVTIVVPLYELPEEAPPEEIIEAVPEEAAEINE
ncbi:MAG: HAMP domain-containing histidine kinase [Clostridia bacterium]|nr:HAMP domain-containing histidine kinase [Clostridia bacterium]MBQ2316296.1 HAMP domain-containing histidine kinase [Clostridia bacterium]